MYDPGHKTRTGMTPLLLLGLLLGAASATAEDDAGAYLLLPLAAANLLHVGQGGHQEGQGEQQREQGLHLHEAAANLASLGLSPLPSSS